MGSARPESRSAMHSTPPKVSPRDGRQQPRFLAQGRGQTIHRDIDCDTPGYLTYGCEFQRVDGEWESKQRKVSALLQSSLAIQLTPLHSELPRV
jgi:hypothetical protein